MHITTRPFAGLAPVQASISMPEMQAELAKRTNEF